MIELVDVMGDDLAVANAARVSFNKWKINFEDKDAKLIRYLAENEHSTPFRHPHLSIRCSAPIFLARQLGKHQVGLTWNEVSRRYVDDNPEIFYPKIWRARPEGGIKQGSGGDFNDQEWCDELYSDVVDLALETYNRLLKNGVAPEQARMVLPQSMMTTWIWSGSLLAFFHIWRLRSGSHAQAEAQEFAEELYKLMYDLFPVSWSALTESA